MKQILIGFTSLLLMVMGAKAQASDTQTGALVIVGGALSSENEVVHKAFIERAKGGAEARFVIIPSASSSPTGSSESFRKTLIRYGVRPDLIEMVQLAVVDDRGTKDVDESKWANSANPIEIAKIATAGAIWFTGGDQARTTRLLLGDNGQDSPMLTMIRSRLKEGAVVGGTSAGAAIMSSTMIARGDSLRSLLSPALAKAEDSDMDGGPLVMAQGLGFLPSSLVDQHFDRKARLGRLARALSLLPQASRLGFGIDEDTAFVVDLAHQKATALGAGGVSLIDARGARFSETKGRFQALALSLSYIGGGDSIDLVSLKITPQAYKKPTKGHEYYDHPAMNGGGMAVPNNRVDEALGVDLVDNSTVSEIKRISFDGEGSGVVYRFSETSNTEGWFGSDATGKARYVISQVKFDILPVTVIIKEAQAKK
jgi:cyanophycinase